MRVALGNVREEHRAALVLRHMEGLSYAEIAETLGIPDGTAKGWVSRGRAAMLKMLGRAGDAQSGGTGRQGVGPKESAQLLPESLPNV